MICSTAQPAPFTCPTLEQSIDATAQLLPTGKAWPANDRSVMPRFLSWLGALVGIPTKDDWADNPGFGQMGYVAAIGAVRNYLETQLCALRLEFWCATETLTNDLWMQEYGLPDDCDPYPNLCVKVAALGGRRCELYQELCAANGWTIDCVAAPSCLGIAYPPVQSAAFQGSAFQGSAFQSQLGPSVPDTPLAALAGCGCAGNIMVGGPAVANHVSIVVHLNESPSFTGGAQTPFLAGRIFAGAPISCEPDVVPLQCLIERIAPAHVIVEYVLSD
jgi:hypothetical protein